MDKTEMRFKVLELLCNTYGSDVFGNNCKDLELVMERVKIITDVIIGYQNESED